MDKFPRSLIDQVVKTLDVPDPESVTTVILEPGHVTVVGLERDQFDKFANQGEKPLRWTRVFPVDFEA